MSRVEWMSFAKLRGDGEPRQWVRWSELLAWAMAEMPGMGQWDVRRALLEAPRPERRYGHNRYTFEHQAAIRAYAERAGLTGRVE